MVRPLKNTHTYHTHILEPIHTEIDKIRRTLIQGLAGCRVRRLATHLYLLHLVQRRTNAEPAAASVHLSRAVATIAFPRRAVALALAFPSQNTARAMTTTTMVAAATTTAAAASSSPAAGRRRANRAVVSRTFIARDRHDDAPSTRSRFPVRPRCTAGGGGGGSGDVYIKKQKQGDEAVGGLRRSCDNFFRG